MGFLIYLTVLTTAVVTQVRRLCPGESPLTQLSYKWD